MGSAMNALSILALLPVRVRSRKVAVTQRRVYKVTEVATSEGWGTNIFVLHQEQVETELEGVLWAPGFETARLWGQHLSLGRSISVVATPDLKLTAVGPS